ncbi:MAG: twin-arginine translocase subunit TatC [Sciscionella sp.]
MDGSVFRPRGGRKEARERRSRRGNPDGTMTLIEHLYELRHRIALAILGIVLGGILGFLWWAHRVGPIPSLGDLIIQPYCDLPVTQRINFANLGTGHTHGCALLQTHPFEAFMIRLKVGIAAGVVLAGPLWLYQFWAFITPGLRVNERRFAQVFVACASLLFAAGAVLAYLVVPEALRVLTGVGGGQFVTALAGENYVSFMISLLVIFGVSFELPLLIVMLNRVRVLKYDRLKQWRRGLIFALFVFAAFATPGQDPISMCALAGALTLLFELAVQVCRIHDRNLARRRQAEGWDDIPDDEATPLEDTPEPVASDHYDDAT